MYTLIFVFVRSSFLFFVFVTGFTFGLFLEHCFHLIILIPKFPKTEKITLRADAGLACGTVFENHRKSLIQHCERSELRLHFEWTKCPKSPIWRVFENLMLAVKQSYQTGQFKIGQKLVENAKIEKFKCDILGYFQTLCCGAFLSYL